MSDNVEKQSVDVTDESERALSRQQQKEIISDIRDSFIIPKKLLTSYMLAYRKPRKRRLLRILFKLSPHQEGQRTKDLKEILISSISEEKRKNQEENKSAFRRLFGRG